MKKWFGTSEEYTDCVDANVGPEMKERMQLAIITDRNSASPKTHILEYYRTEDSMRGGMSISSLPHEDIIRKQLCGKQESSPHQTMGHQEH